MDFNPWEGLARVALGPRHVEMEGLVGSEDYRNRGPRTGIRKQGKGKGSETGRTLVTSVGNMELAQGDVIRKSLAVAAEEWCLTASQRKCQNRILRLRFQEGRFYLRQNNIHTE